MTSAVPNYACIVAVSRLAKVSEKTLKELEESSQEVRRLLLFATGSVDSTRLPQAKMPVQRFYEWVEGLQQSHGNRLNLAGPARRSPQARRKHAETHAEKRAPQTRRKHAARTKTSREATPQARGEHAENARRKHAERRAARTPQARRKHTPEPPPLRPTTIHYHYHPQPLTSNYHHQHTEPPPRSPHPSLLRPPLRTHHPSTHHQHRSQHCLHHPPPTTQHRPTDTWPAAHGQGSRGFQCCKVAIFLCLLLEA